MASGALGPIGTMIISRSRLWLIRALRRMVTRMASFAGFALLPRPRLEELRAQRDAFFGLVKIGAAENLVTRRHEALCVVFSRDRPMQLHALLVSLFEKANNPTPIHVLYHSSSERFEAAYREVLALVEGHAVSVTHEGCFRDDLIRLLRTADSRRIFFLVDDVVFIEDVDLADFVGLDTERFIPTLRLGKNLRRCYTARATQPLPRFVDGVVMDKDKLCWRWADGEFDWGYPLSVDGHLFSTVELALMAGASSFAAPNSFELALQGFADLFRGRYGVSYVKSKIVNIPFNKVQTENRNVAGRAHQDYLLERWEEGFQIDYRNLYGLRNESAHQELPLRLVRRQP
jgi:hypothetical protein